MPLTLSRRELNIIEYFVRNRGRSVSKAQVFQTRSIVTARLMSLRRWSKGTSASSAKSCGCALAMIRSIQAV